MNNIPHIPPSSRISHRNKHVCMDVHASHAFLPVPAYHLDGGCPWLTSVANQFESGGWFWHFWWSPLEPDISEMVTCMGLHTNSTANPRDSGKSMCNHICITCITKYYQIEIHMLHGPTSAPHWCPHTILMVDASHHLLHVLNMLKF